MLLAVGVAATASAYQGNYAEKGPEYSPERHEAMTKVFENKDYSAWKEMIAGRGRITEVINEDNFTKFIEAHRLGTAGDVAGADVIRKELGLRTSNGERVGAGYGKGQGDRQGSGKMNSENRGQNRGGKFIDADNDGNCDNL